VCCKSGIVLKIQNGEGVIHVYEVDEWGYQGLPITVEPINHYRHSGFALVPTYVCECQIEFSFWDDVLEHIQISQSL
jgi:hypothetical protein